MRRITQLVRAFPGRVLVVCAGVIVATAAAAPALAQTAMDLGLRDSSFVDDGTDGTMADAGFGGSISPTAGRPVLRDGDLDYPREADTVRDGILTPAMPEEAGAVEDSALVDQRDADSIAAFENPPAGHDPLLFQIENIAPSDPRLNRLPRRLFEQEPYDPVGITIGSFVLFPEVEISGARFSNVFASPNAQSDGALDITPAGRLVSNWSTHTLEFRGAGDFSFYNEYTSENDRGYLLEARGRLDATRRTNVQAVASRQRAKESRSAIDASSIGDPSFVTQDLAASTLTHRFNRLTVQLTGTLTDTQYETTGLAAADDRDSTERALGARASWEFKPTLAAFAVIEANDRAFDRAATSDDLNRASTGRRYRGGISFGDTGQILRGELSVGYGVQDFDAVGLNDVEGAIFDANLAWRLNALTALLLSAGTDFSETTMADAGGVLEHRVALDARHAFRPSLIGTAGIAGMRRSYAGIDIDESELALRLGLEYYLAREAVLFGRYEHLAFRSDFLDGDYDADEFRIGLRLRR